MTLSSFVIVQTWSMHVRQIVGKNKNGETELSSFDLPISISWLQSWVCYSNDSNALHISVENVQEQNSSIREKMYNSNQIAGSEKSDI